MSHERIRAAAALATAILLLTFGGACDRSVGGKPAGGTAPPAAGAAPGNGIAVSPEQSDIVTKGPDGVPGVARKDGTPIDGIKLSQHDKNVITPNVAVAPDGAIHVAFTEQSAVVPYPFYVYHRQSGDGGKTWSKAKNLSEDMPDIAAGGCKLLVDAGGRVYVVWTSAIRKGLNPVSGNGTNLVYRVLDHGKWSKILNVHPPTRLPAEDNGAMSFYAAVDGAAARQVIWNVLPDSFHPEAMTVSNGQKVHANGIGLGLVFQATLDGPKPTAPHEIYMAPIHPGPAGRDFAKSCDGFSNLDGYVDAAGAPHFVARVTPRERTTFELIEGGKQAPAIELPGTFDVRFNSQPTLLVDAKGRRHVVALYEGGEHQTFRDYPLGSDEDPAVILAAKGPKGTCLSFQAYQGPGGRMAVVMQTTDAGFVDSGDSWLSVSDGGKWSPPVCVTNNAARAGYVVRNKGARLAVGAGDHYGPALVPGQGGGAVAFDKEGRLLLALVNVRTGTFGFDDRGITVAGNRTASPILSFYRF